MTEINFNFWCKKDNFDFSLEVETKDDTLLSLPKNKIFCPKCGKEAKVMGRESQGISTPLTDRIKRAHINETLSGEALRMAAEARRENPVEEVNVTSSQKGSAGRTERIPKKIVDSILEKVKGEEVFKE